MKRRNKRTWTRIRDEREEGGNVAIKLERGERSEEQGRHIEHAVEKKKKEEEEKKRRGRKRRNLSN